MYTVFYNCPREFVVNLSVFLILTMLLFYKINIIPNEYQKHNILNSFENGNLSMKKSNSSNIFS